MLRPSVLSFLALVTLMAPQSYPQSSAGGVDQVFFNGLHYRLVGPSRGGRVTTVTGVPSQPKTFYMGVASGGLFRTTDGGQTWKFIGLYNAGQIGAVRIHPTNPNIVWVTAQGDAFKSNSERGVFKTTDGGQTWRKVLFISDQVGAMDLEIKPDDPNIVYAWMSRLERKPWTIISGSREGGFYKSTDGGEHFAKITNGLPNELIGKANLAVTAAKPNRVYALVEAKPGGGLYRSDDAGQTWTLDN